MDDGSRLPEIAAQASPELTPWIIAVALLFCAMFFAVTETAFASASRTKIKVAAERGEAGAKKALYVMDNFDMAISTLLICTNIVHIATASLVTVAVTRIWAQRRFAEHYRHYDSGVFCRRDAPQEHRQKVQRALCKKLLRRTCILLWSSLPRFPSF
ncbi:MAG: DUF21 domain-containing protein [Oscillospiraceae bacterium]